MQLITCNAGKISYEPTITHDHICYIPREQAPYEPYTRPKNTASPDVQKLYDDVYSIINDFIDVSEDFKHLIATVIFFSYQQNKSHTTPYLYAHGEKGSGKSRILEILENLCYRPLMATAISGPNIIQYLEDGPVGTILDDEVKESIEYDSDKRSIYLSGYRKTGKVPKILTDRNGRRKQVFFNAFSLKAFSSKYLAQHDQLIDRCILISMIKGNPKYGGFSTDGTDYKRFQIARNRLLIWRLYTYFDIFSQERPKSRQDEIFLPLLKTAKFINNDTSYQAIVRIKDRDRIEKEEEMRSSLEAKILIAILKVNYVRKNLTIPFKDVFTNLSTVIKGSVEDGKIKSPDFGEVTRTLVGRRLKGIFKGKSKQTNYKGNYIVVYTFSKETLEKAISTYKIKKEDL